MVGGIVNGHDSSLSLNLDIDNNIINVPSYDINLLSQINQKKLFDDHTRLSKEYKNVDYYGMIHDDKTKLMLVNRQLMNVIKYINAM